MEKCVLIFVPCAERYINSLHKCWLRFDVSFAFVCRFKFRKTATSNISGKIKDFRGIVVLKQPGYIHSFEIPQEFNRRRKNTNSKISFVAPAISDIINFNSMGLCSSLCLWFSWKIIFKRSRTDLNIFIIWRILIPTVVFVLEYFSANQILTEYSIFLEQASNGGNKNNTYYSEHKIILLRMSEIHFQQSMFAGFQMCRKSFIRMVNGILCSFSIEIWAEYRLLMKLNKVFR